MKDNLKEEKQQEEMEQEEVVNQEEPVSDEAQEEPKDELAQQKALADDYYNRLLRMQADFENFKRRVRQEKEEFYKYASESLMLQLLPVVDNFERALAAGGDDGKNLLTGIQMIERQLKEVLQKEGLQAIETVGQEFDPNLHDAVMQVESDEYSANTCVEELQKGYRLKDKVIRPAMVKVAQ